MDPYLESRGLWPDFHLTMVVAMRADLNRRLPARYSAAADRHVWVEEPDGDLPPALRIPDAYVVEEEEEAGSAERPSSRTAVLAPQTITLPMREGRGAPYLRIVDREGHRLVTAIELLSPGNRSTGPTREAYLAKREEYLRGNVNLVELDLHRGGRRLPLGRPAPRLSDYYVLVCRADERPRASLWAFSVRDPFPAIEVPLAPGESVPLDIRGCLDRAYQEARYAREIDYSSTPVPPLRARDAAWARRLLSETTSRTPNP
jgi:hypothetical protein